MENRSNVLVDMFIKESPLSIIRVRFIELFFSIEALISYPISLITLIILYSIYKDNFSVFLEVITPLTLALITGLIAMIAFSLSALALILTSFKITDVESLIEEKKGVVNLEKVKNFRLIIFRFFMASILNLISIFLLLIGYLLINSSMYYREYFTYIFNYHSILNNL